MEASLLGLLGFLQQQKASIEINNLCILAKHKMSSVMFIMCIAIELCIMLQKTLFFNFLI